MPYNFFYGNHQNEFKINFVPVLERMLKYTGKRTIIVGHSFGAVQAVEQLHFMPRKLKD